MGFHCIQKAMSSQWRILKDNTDRFAFCFFLSKIHCKDLIEDRQLGGGESLQAECPWTGEGRQSARVLAIETEMRELQESHGRWRQDTDWWLIGQRVKRMWGFEDQNHSRFPVGQLVYGTAIHWEEGHRNSHTGLKAAVRLIPSSFPMLPMRTWTPSLEDICSPLPFLPALHQLQLAIFWALSFLAGGG